MVFTTTLIAVLLAVSTLAFSSDSPRSFASFSLRNKPGWLFGIQLLCVFTWQLMILRNQEYNVDESTWIANALAVIRDKDFFSALLTHTTARPVTVLPLLALDALGLPINFYYAKVVSLFCIVLTLGLTYLSLRNLTNARFATLSLFPLTIFYLAVQFDDFLAYNSELVCNVFVGSGIWLFSLIVGKRDRFWSICSAGLLLGLIPFAKFQAIPGALIVAGFCLYELIRQRRFAPASLFVIVGLLPLLVAVGYCLLTGQVTTLIRNYFLYYFHYSYQYSAKPFSERFSPRDIVHYYRKQYTFAVYWIGLILLMAVGVWQSRRSAFRPSSTILMLTLLWVVSIYETIQAGTNYEHYLNLVLAPHTLLAALLIYPVITHQSRQPVPIQYGYVAVALVITFFSRTKPFERGYEPPLPYDSEVVALIKKECSPQDRIAIWGWADRYYALSGIAPASRYANSGLQMKANAQQDYHLGQYVLDLQRNKPVLFLDAVAKNQFTYSNQGVYGHEHFPTVNRVITDAYQLIYEHEGLRAYKLKSAHKSRVANRVMSALKVPPASDTLPIVTTHKSSDDS